MPSGRFRRPALRPWLLHNGSLVSRWRKASTSASMAIGPYCPSTCASAASVWGSQKVISIDVYISMAVDNAV